MSILWSKVIWYTAISSISDSTIKEIELADVIISINKFDEKRRELPFQISQISAKEISFQNAPNTADLLINTGEVFVQKSQGGGGSPILRGLEANRILLSIDGIRMNNAIFRSGHLQNVLRVDQNILEKVEVIFGPSSLIYGSDALGGVVSFKTKDPILNHKEINAFLRYASAMNEKTVHLDWQFGSKKIAWLSSINYSDFGDIRQGENRLEKYPEFGKRYYFVRRENEIDKVIINEDPELQVHSGYSQLDITQKILFSPSENIQHLLNFQYSSSSNVPRYDRLTEGDISKPKYAEWYYGPEKRFMAAYQMKIFNKRWFNEAQLSLAWQDLKESRNKRIFESSERKVQQENVKALSLNADFVKYIKRNTLQYGVELIKNIVSSEAHTFDISDHTYGQNTTRYPDGGSDMQWASIYYVHKYKTESQKLIFNNGIRFNYTGLNAEFIDKTYFPYDEDNISQASGNFVFNLGLVYLPNLKDRISFSVASGFRVPNVDDMAKVFDSKPGTLIVPNPSLKAEKTISYELNLGHSDEKIELNASLYLIDFWNILALAPFSLNGQTEIEYDGELSKIYALQNKERARIMGTSISGLFKFSPQMFISGTMTYTKGYFLKSKKPLDHIPPLFGKLDLGYRGKNWDISFYSLFNAWKKIEDYNLEGEDNPQFATEEGMPSWYTLNFKANWRLNNSINLQASIENILDKNYRYFASGISAPGRNVSLAFRLNL